MGIDDGQGHGLPPGRLFPGGATPAQEILAFRVAEVQEEAELLASSIRTLLRVPVTDGGIVAAAKADVDASLKTLLEAVSNLCAGFV